MQQLIILKIIRHLVQASFILACGLVSFNANAKDNCPAIGSPESVALEFQLFSAFQTGYDGYETPCELKCFGKEKCQNSCQAKFGLQFLSKQMTDLKKKKGIKQCPTYTLSCIKQCEKLGPDCVKTCEGLDTVASQ